MELCSRKPVHICWNTVFINAGIILYILYICPGTTYYGTPGCSRDWRLELFKACEFDFVFKFGVRLTRTCMGLKLQFKSPYRLLVIVVD